MYRLFADIVAVEATGVLNGLAGLKSESHEIITVKGSIECIIAARITFDGRVKDCSAAHGFLAIGFGDAQAATTLAKAVVVHNKLENAFELNSESTINIFSEYLNMVIGLAEADWRTKNLEINFDPPDGLFNTRIDIADNDVCYKIMLHVPNMPTVDLFLNFAAAA